MRCSIIIPLYNEEKRITASLPILMQFLRSKVKTHVFEIILVNDGSNDGTATLIESFMIKYPRLIRVFHLKSNQGKGYAVKEGVINANGDLIFFLDADLSVDLSALIHSLKLFSQNKNLDAVVASRRLPDSRIVVHQPIMRETLGHMFTLLGKTILNLPFHDLTCGFKGFRRRVAKRIFPQLTSYRWAFDAEVLYLLHLYGYETLELAISWKNNPQTKVRLLKDIPLSLFELVRIRTNNYNITRKIETRSFS